MEPSGQPTITSLFCNDTRSVIDPSLAVPDSCLQLFDDGSVWTTLNENKIIKLLTFDSS
jgi:hypothetical protein